MYLYDVIERRPFPPAAFNQNKHITHKLSGPLSQARSDATTYEKLMRLEYGYAVATEVNKKVESYMSRVYAYIV